ncbi:hypothetical protein HMPREF9080_01834 [Cardiobacterium valvarum F0432]|uniref:Uncharacterized protein n=1 Tax=Cardiobacterium valvarum F0432 TaxID=797473 RepID=G9ZGD1_9GAMM|nr:hypothetical protein HMPREF9080_01834 [Cardiobacterium valvarum F0432]
MAEGGEVRIVRGNIGRIADDEVGAFVSKGGKPVTVQEADIRHAETAGVFRGDRQRRRALIAAGDIGVGAGARDSQRQRTAAGAEIKHRRAGNVAQKMEGALHHRFAVAARDEGGAADGEIKPVERLIAEQVGERFARVQTGGKRVKRRYSISAEIGVVDALLRQAEAGHEGGKMAGFQQRGLAIGMGGGAAVDPEAEFHDGECRRMRVMYCAGLMSPAMRWRMSCAAKASGGGRPSNTVFAREISLVAGAFLLRGRAAVEVRIAGGGIGGEDGGELGGSGHGREGRAMVRDRPIRKKACLSDRLLLQTGAVSLRIGGRTRGHARLVQPLNGGNTGGVALVGRGDCADAGNGEIDRQPKHDRGEQGEKDGESRGFDGVLFCHGCLQQV